MAQMKNSASVAVTLSLPVFLARTKQFPKMKRRSNEVCDNPPHEENFDTKHIEGSLQSSRVGPDRFRLTAQREYGRSLGEEPHDFFEG